MEEKYVIKQYIFDPLLAYYTPIEIEVSNQKELLALPWVKSFHKHSDFARFSISKHEGYHYLMVENDLCNWWLIVAILPENFPSTLPLFKSVLDKLKVEENA